MIHMLKIKISVLVLTPILITVIAAGCSSKPVKANAASELPPEPTVSQTTEQSDTANNFINSDWLSLSGNAKLLTDDEVDWFNNDFFLGTNRYSFLTSTYDAPEKINLYELFHNGADAGINSDAPTIEEIKKLIYTYGHYNTEIGEFRIRASDMDKMLVDNMGITLDQANRVDLTYDYLTEYDSYYYRNSGGNYDLYKMLYGYKENGSVYLFYDQKTSIRDAARDNISCDNLFRVELLETESGYLFRTNLRVTQTDGAISYIVDNKDTSGEKENKPTVQYSILDPYEKLSTPSFEAAIDNICSQEHFQYILTDIENAWKVYGKLLYGEFVDNSGKNEPAFYFVSLDGSVYVLPPPIGGSNEPVENCFAGDPVFAVYYCKYDSYRCEYYFFFSTKELYKSKFSND